MSGMFWGYRGSPDDAQHGSDPCFDWQAPDDGSIAEQYLARGSARRERDHGARAATPHTDDSAA